MIAAPNTLDRTSRFSLPHIIINAGPHTLTRESGSIADSNIWQLVGVAEDLSVFEGVEVFPGTRAFDPENTSDPVAWLVVVCDPNSPAGRVMLSFATEIDRQARLEADYSARNDPDDGDFCPPGLNWLWPLQEVVRLGGRLKDEADRPEDSKEQEGPW
jgi:hypothetical protein